MYEPLKVMLTVVMCRFCLQLNYLDLKKGWMFMLDNCAEVRFLSEYMSWMCDLNFKRASLVKLYLPSIFMIFRLYYNPSNAYLQAENK